VMWLSQNYFSANCNYLLM